MKALRTLEFLHQRGNEVQSIHLGLHRIRTLLETLGNPHLKFAVLHIAGTNGKGSVAAMSESMLRQGGWKTGLYTSPHLVRLEERIRVKGRMISGGRLSSLAERVRLAEAALVRSRKLDRPTSFFEFVTACAFLHFAEQNVDIAIVEVGLGGRLDATNVVAPQACIITGISLDHQDLLGNTIAEIAAEKAGIIKRDIPVISGCQASAARRTVIDTARDAEAPLLEIDRACSIRVRRQRRGRFVIDVRTPRHLYRNLSLALAGEHQTRNATLAIAGIEALASFPIKPGHVRRGLKTAQWPGRMDEYQARKRTLVDGAHNPEGARLLEKHLSSLPYKEIHLVFGVLKDKDYRAMGRLLFPHAAAIHVTRISSPRTAEPEDVAKVHARLRAKIVLHNDAREALRAAWERCPANGLVVVTGSLYLIGELLPMIRANLKNRAQAIRH